MKSRLKKSSVSLLAILIMAILMVLPTGYEDAVIYKGTDKAVSYTHLKGGRYNGYIF